MIWHICVCFVNLLNVLVSRKLFLKRDKSIGLIFIHTFCHSSDHLFLFCYHSPKQASVHFLSSELKLLSQRSENTISWGVVNQNTSVIISSHSWLHLPSAITHSRCQRAPFHITAVCVVIAARRAPLLLVLNIFPPYLQLVVCVYMW